MQAPAILALATIIVSLPPMAVAETPKSPSDELQGPPEAKPAQVVLAALGLPEAGEISLRLGSYGTIELLYGEDVQLSLPKLGCDGTEDIVTCFLDAYGNLFGWDGWEPHGGALVALPPELSGEFVEHRLQLVVTGVPVENAWVNLRIWDNSVVVAAKSTLFPASAATNSVDAAVAMASEKASDSLFIDDSILDHLSADVSASSSPAAFEVKSLRASLRAIHGGGGKLEPRLRVFAELDGVEALYLIDVASGAVTELPAENPSPGVAYIDSTAIYPYYSPTLTCPPVSGGTQGMGPYPTTECGSNGYCIDFTWPSGMGQCATACLTDSDCPQDYECQVSPNAPAGACEISDEVVPPGTYPDAPYYPVYGFGLFTSPGLAVNPKWSALASNLEAVRVFHTADCGRPGGWDNDGGSYVVRHYTKTTSYTAPATSSYLTGTVRVFSADGFLKPLFLGHEYGHLIIQADRDGDHIGLSLTNCMFETLPEMFGRLFARKLLVPGSSTQPVWRDDRSGPSGERTFFSWPTIGPGGCESNAYAHTEVLGRFFRILVEGPEDLTNDGFGEDIGVSFSPVSVSSAAKVYHDAVYAMDVDDWYGELTRGMESSAIAEGVATQVRLALGASGFFSRDSIVSTTAAETGAASYFDAYTAGTSKLFTAWRDAASGTIRVRRQVGAAGVTEDLGMAAAGPPTVAAHGDKLYVGWVKASGTGASCLHWVYYNADGTRSNTYSGSDAGVCHISGEVEIVSHTGLYAFFVQTGTSDLKYSRCDALPCTGRLTDWKVLASGARVRTLATDVTAGVFGLSVPGSPGYVWLAGRSPATNVILWKMQFDAAGGESLTTHSSWLGESSSSPTIDVRQGAFGDNRVYAFWRKSNATDIIMKMGAYPMLPVQTFRSTASRLGVTRGLPVDADRTELLHFSPDGAFSKAVLYGRH